MMRRQFGLVVERHQPEGVELPRQPIRSGCKVRVLPKLRGVADFAEKFGSKFRRIESVAATSGKLKALGLTEHNVRQAASNATGATA